MAVMVMFTVEHDGEETWRYRGALEDEPELRAVAMEFARAAARRGGVVTVYRVETSGRQQVTRPQVVYTVTG
jgi:hypothetical protein